VKHAPRRERGATFVEFAFAFPILILLMLTIVDLGWNYGNKVQNSNAARVGARLGSVGRYGTTSNCPTFGLSESSTQTRSLICLTKSRSGIDPSSIRVRFFYIDQDGKYTTDFSQSARYANKYSLVLCTSTAAQSVSGMLSAIIGGHFHHARAVMKTGSTQDFDLTPSGEKAYFHAAEGEESPMTKNGVTDTWDWCKADDPVNGPF
jgi:hypothetical protein